MHNFAVLRGRREPRNGWLKWQAEPAATGYVIHCGVTPEKLYTSLMVYGATEYYFNAMDRDRTYYFQIEAFNEAGISERSAVVKRSERTFRLVAPITVPSRFRASGRPRG